MRQALGDPLLIAKELDTLGNIQRDLGAYGQALQTLQRSLDMRRTLGDQYAVAETELNIGLVHFSQGNYARAIDAYKRAMALASGVGTRGLESEALANIGAAAWRLGQAERARANFQATLAVSEREGRKAPAASSLTALGEIARSRGRPREAEEMLGRALRLREEMKDQRGIVEVLNGQARLHMDDRRFDRAVAAATRAVAVARQFEQREVLWEALTLLGTAHLRLGRGEEGRRALHDAVAEVERLRKDVTGPPGEGQHFFETKLSPYHELIALAVANGSPGEALELAERAKARALADILRRGGELIGGGATAEERAEERRLRSRLRALNRRVLSERASEAPDAQRLSAREAEREAARAAYGAFLSTLYSRHPDLRLQRGEVAPFALAEASALVADPQTAVLEFVVADRESHVFVLTAGGDRVDVGARRLAVTRDQLAARVRRLRDRLAARDLAFAEDARSLHDLLIGPVRAALDGRTRLILVPDGPLWEAPFQALRDGRGRYVVETAAVSYAPSLTILRETVRRTARHRAAPTVLAMGQARSDLAPLPEAERQVRDLALLYAPGRSAVYVGDEATEERFKAEAPRHRIVHVASHGLYEETSPLYSSVLLSRAPAPSQEDGLLEAWELLDLKLDADVVVLSACETGRGRIASGEGIVGTLWALLGAGARSAVVSQWKVEAASTTALMLGLHRGLAGGESGTADHLRRATLDVMRTPRFAHPFYWAPFVLVGHPR
jgi:CHAT domain-containing protein